MVTKHVKIIFRLIINRRTTNQIINISSFLSYQIGKCQKKKKVLFSAHKSFMKWSISHALLVGLQYGIISEKQFVNMYQEP